MPISIDHGGVEDIEGAIALSKTVPLDPKDPYAGEKGFILYPKTPEWLLECIEHGACFVVAKDEGRIFGYLLGYTHALLEHACNAVPEVADVWQWYLQKGDRNIICIDHLVVSPDYANQGHGKAILEFVYQEFPSATVWTEICLGPVRNERSIRFFESNGFTKRQEMQTEKQRVGMYEKVFG